MRPVISGSSEKYSKMRPPRGSRTRFAAPPSRTLNPLPLASAPTASPWRRASDEVPAGGQRQVGRHRRRRVARPDVPRIGDAELGVGFLQGRNAEPAGSRERSPPSRSRLQAWAARPRARRDRRGRATASPAGSSVRERSRRARTIRRPSSPQGAAAADVARSASPPDDADEAARGSHGSGAPCRRTKSAKQLHRRYILLRRDGARSQTRACAPNMPSMERYSARNQTRAPAAAPLFDPRMQHFSTYLVPVSAA